MSIVDNSLKSFSVKSTLPQWILWCIAIVLFTSIWITVGAIARSSALRDLKDYRDTWTEDGILIQPTDYACVPAAIVMLLTEQGFSPTLYEIADLSGTDIRGTGSSGIIRAGNYFGFEVSHERVTFEQFMEMGSPGIIIFSSKGARHAAFISAIRDYNILRVKDPVQGLLHFEPDGANDYFEGDLWDCFIFRRGLLISPDE